jgi:hypothetical protein
MTPRGLSPFCCQQTAPFLPPGLRHPVRREKGTVPLPFPAPPHKTLIPMCYAKYLERAAGAPLPPTGTECI